MAAVLVLAAALVGLPLALFLAQERLIFHPQPLSEARRLVIAKQYPWVEQVYLEAPDGARLHAWRVHGRKGERAQGQPGAPLSVVLYFGGNAEDVAWMIPEAAARAPGFDWLLISYRGYGGSEGSPSEAKLSADALLWHDYATRKLGAEQVVLFGRSLGSGPAVHVASQRSVAALVLVTPFDSLVAVAKRHYPLLPVGLLLRHRFDSLALAPHIRAPLLCIAAARDQVVPAEHARRLYEAWDGPKRWLELEGAGHNDTDGAPAFWPNVEAFLQQWTARQQANRP
ncbi:MAG TPA: alpha/beta hydrolase [Burkholderiales bacterium]|nr:alpha/beta hydrolase [Burkholderiales bacterium]